MPVGKRVLSEVWSLRQSESLHPGREAEGGPGCGGGLTGVGSAGLLALALSFMTYSSCHPDKVDIFDEYFVMNALKGTPDFLLTSGSIY